MRFCQIRSVFVGFEFSSIQPLNPKDQYGTMHAIKPQDSVYAVQSLGRRVEALAISNEKNNSIH